MRTRKWQDSDRSSTEIIANEMHILDSKSSTSGDSKTRNIEEKEQEIESDNEFDDIPF